MYYIFNITQSTLKLKLGISKLLISTVQQMITLIIHFLQLRLSRHFYMMILTVTWKEVCTHRMLQGVAEPREK